MRRRLLLLLVVLAVLAVAAGALWTSGSRDGDRQDASPGSPGRWRLVWHDEFDGSGLDTRRWRAEDRSTFGDGNGELACLMDRPENLSVSDGQLHLTARREPTGLPCGAEDQRFPQGRAYSSAMISTQGKASWRYGRFEVRARLPVTPGRSQGLWPAFWMRPDDGGKGEIDVLEALGTSDPDPASVKIHQTIWFDYDKTYPQESHGEPLASAGSPTAFHTYAVTWTPSRLRWFLDGRQVFERSRSTTPWFGQAFDRPFFLRLNLAVGGRWPGDPTEQTLLPASFDVDYVRVWSTR